MPRSFEALLVQVAVAVGKRPCLSVYGNDYATPDGTGVRDYIHVQDLAQGHVAAVQALLGKGESFTVNLGTGQGHSVLEVVRAFEQASGQPVPYQFAPRRAGDVAQCYADASLAQRLLGWRATHTRRICAPMPGVGKAATRTGTLKGKKWLQPLSAEREMLSIV